MSSQILFKIYKEFYIDNEHVGHGMSSTSFRSGYCSGFHGYSNMTKAQFDALKAIVKPAQLDNNVYPGAHTAVFSFMATPEQIDQAGIMFLIPKSEDSPFAYASIDTWNGTNENYRTVSIYRAMENLQTGRIVQSSEEYDAVKKGVITEKAA
jgi:hypothetical protein